MSSDRPAGDRHAHWWQRRGPSSLVFAGVLTVFAVAGVFLAVRVSAVLPRVGQDLQGEDVWTDPIGLERAGSFQVAHIPDCAIAPVAKIVLWDDDNRRLWEVSGPAAPLKTFVVGDTPKGFQVDTPFRAPRAGAMLRLVVIRRLKGAAGIRYQPADLRKGRVVALSTLSRFTVEGFQTEDVCTSEATGPTDASSPSTSLLGG